MVPADAYDHKLDRYQQLVNQAEQLCLDKMDKRYTEISPVHIRIQTRAFQWSLHSVRYHHLVTKQASFLILVLGYIVVILIAYA